MKTFAKWLPVVVVAIFALWLGSKARMPKAEPGQMQLQAFGRLPVVYQGRCKPFDTLARNSLVVLSDKQTFKDSEGETQPALKWLLDVITRMPRAENHQVFRIHNLELLNQLGLEEREGFRYGLAEFKAKLDVLTEQAIQASSRPAKERSAYERSVLTLANHLEFYRLLVGAHRDPHVHDSASLDTALQFFMDLSRDPNSRPLVHAVAPLGDDATPMNEGDPPKWRPLVEGMIYDDASSLVDSQSAHEGMKVSYANPSVTSLRHILNAYRQDDATTFNSEVAAYQELIDASKIEGTDRLGYEMFFNHFAPFYHAAAIYVFAFLLGCFSWIGWSEPLRRSAFWLTLFTFIVHTFGLVSRIYISGYPPVTTLYSSAIFIGWGCVILGLIIEALYRIGVGNLAASVAGFITLVIAHFLSLDGDTFEMMQAVLDTKFWLATHVTTVTLGYSATFFAGLIAIRYLIARLTSRGRLPEIDKQYGRIMYGVLCFALLLSFIGTVLGGLWADDSWGRFWGWDPKENGALIIVLWNALILHARWGGMVKTRGIAVLAVFGNIVTSWSWFGVNQLGVGLHAYGWTDSVAYILMLFIGSQLLIMLLGAIPVSKNKASGGSSKGKGHVSPPSAVIGDSPS